MTRREPITLAPGDVYSWAVRWNGTRWQGELRTDVRIAGRRDPALPAVDTHRPGSRAAAGSNRGMLETAGEQDVADAAHETKHGDCGGTLPLFGGMLP